MLQQEIMIEQVRRVCHEEDRLVAAMMYGSFAQSEGDEFSDIEFVLFFDDKVLSDVDQEEWVSRVGPVELYLVNEYGVGTAIFEGLIRGEFHFEEASNIEKVDESLRETDWLPSLEATLVLDRTGELTRRLEEVVGPPPDRDTPERVEVLINRFVNWFLFGSNLLMRGELARALEYLGFVQRHLLWMVRLSEETITHWPTPSKALEQDISEASYARYAACTATLDEVVLRDAYLSAWGWGKESMLRLSERHELHPPVALLDRIGRRLAEKPEGAAPSAPGAVHGGSARPDVTGDGRIELAEQVASRLGRVGGVVAVALGGSRARGEAYANSDLDLGIYYRPDNPPAIGELRRAAEELDDRHPQDAATVLGEWGPWINGGAWLRIEGQPVDWLYRDLDKVEKVFAECRAGQPTCHYQPGHPHGFHNHIYMGEIHHCRSLFDPRGELTALKAQATEYPQPLKLTLIDKYLWEAGFALYTARKSTARGDVFYVSGCSFRCVACLVQVLFALNERYFVNEKGSVKAAGSFALCPPGFAEVVEDVLGRTSHLPSWLEGSIERLGKLVEEVRGLCDRALRDGRERMDDVNSGG